MHGPEQGSSRFSHNDDVVCPELPSPPPLQPASQQATAHSLKCQTRHRASKLCPFLNLPQHHKRALSHCFVDDEHIAFLLDTTYYSLSVLYPSRPPNDVVKMTLYFTLVGRNPFLDWSGPSATVGLAQCDFQAPRARRQAEASNTNRSF